MFSNMPNQLTKHDEELIAHVLVKDGLCKHIYDVDGYCIHVTGYDLESEVLNIERHYIDIFSTVGEMNAVDKMTVELDILTMDNFLPTSKGSSYAEFKEVSLMEDWMVNGEISQHPFIQKLAEQGIDVKSPEDTKVIYNPQTEAFMLYSPSQEHPYTYLFGNEAIEADAFDFAYKLAFDAKEYTSKSHQDFLDFLDSPEGKASTKACADELLAEIEASRAFYESERYSELMALVENAIIDNSVFINYDNCIDYGFKDGEEFMAFYEATRKNGEQIEDKEADFKTLYVTQGKLEFSETHGQGSFYLIKLSERG